MYIKSKVNQTTFQIQPGFVLDGELLNAAFLNHIQTQYQQFLDDNKDVYGQYLCLVSKTVTPTGNTITLDGPIIGNPFVFVGKKLYNSREESQDFDLASGFIYKYGEKKLTGQSVMIAGRVCVVYYYTVLNHADTHKIGGSDPIDIHDLNGYTKEEIDALIPNVITEEEMTVIAENKKKSQSAALSIRTSTSGTQNELYDQGLV